MSVAFSTSAARRIVATLFITQSLGSAALIANATVNPIRLMQRFGRRWGLAIGFFAGCIGMVIGGVAIVAHIFPLFLLGLLLIGAARGALDQSRYAAADAPPARSARSPGRRWSLLAATCLASWGPTRWLGQCGAGFCCLCSPVC
jgi:hypothetical protein